jgi:hypothetical protein
VSSLAHLSAGVKSRKMFVMILTLGLRPHVIPLSCITRVPLCKSHIQSAEVCPGKWRKTQGILLSLTIDYYVLLVGDNEELNKSASQRRSRIQTCAPPLQLLYDQQTNTHNQRAGQAHCNALLTTVPRAHTYSSLGIR